MTPKLVLYHCNLSTPNSQVNASAHGAVASGSFERASWSINAEVWALLFDPIPIPDSFRHGHPYDVATRMRTCLIIMKSRMNLDVDMTESIWTLRDS
jgi:hypothetical protein